MPLFDTILKHPVKSTDAIFKFLYQHALEGSFILSFYDVPAETWAKISQLQFPLEIIVDLVDTEVESKLPESLKGYYLKGDKVVLSFPYEFEQLLRTDIKIEDVALIIDGDIRDPTCVKHALEVLELLSGKLNLLSDYTFTFWIEDFNDGCEPLSKGTTTIAVDLEGITPHLIVDLDSTPDQIPELIESHPFKKTFEEETGIILELSLHTRKIISNLQKSGAHH